MSFTGLDLLRPLRGTSLEPKVILKILQEIPLGQAIYVRYTLS